MVEVFARVRIHGLIVAAVVLPGGDLALQARGQELLVRPVLRPGPVGQPVDRVPQRRRLERPGQESDLAQGVPAGGGGGGHQATVPPVGPVASSPVPSAVS